MKKCLVSALLCFALFVVASPEAQALVQDDRGYTYANQEMYEFWQTHRDELYKKYGISAVGQQAFHDGLLLVHSIYGQCGDLYVTRDAKVIDLNQGRFDRMFAFSDGLAAVSKGNYYGYINTEGTLAIPIQFPTISVDSYNIQAGRFIYSYGIQVGKFIGDTALVVGEYSELEFYGPLNPDNFSVNPVWDHFWHLDLRGEHPDTLPAGLDYVFIAKDGRMIDPPETIYEEQQSLVFMNGCTWNYLGEGTMPVEPVYTAPNPVVPWVEYKGAETGEITTPGIPEPQTPTYGQASVKARGYTIENNNGYLLIDVTNNGAVKDQGDLFYILYNKYKKAEGIISNTTDFLPTDYITQIHYEVGAKETKTLRVPVGILLDYDLTEENREGGWFESEMIADSRFVLAQAESEAECAELVSFFKAAHDYGETKLDYVAVGGVTVLAAPYPSMQRVDYLNQKLSALTSQF